MTSLDDEIARLNALPDHIRKQAKFDHIIALMQNEGGNFSAGVYISVLAGFVIALMNNGFDPQKVLKDLMRDASRETERLLAEQGILSKAPAKRLDS